MYSTANLKCVCRTLFLGVNKVFCFIIISYACLRFVDNLCVVATDMGPTPLHLIYISQRECKTIVQL
jgi:hypothetical protein